MEYLAVLLPSLAVGAIFYFVMRAIFNADRAEREAEAAERTARDNSPAQSPSETVADVEDGDTPR
ncbi:hypothetical protein BJ994_003439 [Arthrobacter pigmenti]|uniref:Uncharacterized protein n=1 Tax=Arthrobacter pigmenti TaxID=271432 RepID=A0A846RM95_9MICC|nr:hypothetical protein [Arthrobacter pigmenti]NJC24363.1 hypothetical protein [Arthrobacter pigmenti]